ncbi:hypothetical protein [Spiractinospora alimapuensis]|uniref:hypothetical protein n=1 Tax=Spiractinospora alimapuensis TaxID=2820884 RepID=UPI001F37F4A5|nr:hypothetical protein [Spiractinospora alimapuensis]
MTARVAQAQEQAARQAEPYLGRVLGTGSAVAPVARVVPGSLAGVASDGRSLVSLMAYPAIVALGAIRRGESIARALASGLASLLMFAGTQIFDAGRVADELGIAARPRVGIYTRVVEPGACPRCLVLAGRQYRWSTGFLRHPQCKCQTVPMRPDEYYEIAQSPQSIFDAMTTAEQDARFGAGAAEAIRQGADMNQIVNAQRGMTSAGYTTEGTTRRGWAYRRLQGQPRLMPEAIMQNANSRDEAIDLLRQHGYLD